MSGDVQPRKRKEKRRKKEDSEEIASNFSSDEHIHIHKDVSTGGNICAKILFFLLSSVLLVMIGLVVFEYRGFGDDEALVPVSKWAPTFDGWLDETHVKHDVQEEVSDSEERGAAESEEQSDETIEQQKKSAGIHKQSREVDSEEEVNVKIKEPKNEVKVKHQHLEGSDTVSAGKWTKEPHEEQDKLATRAAQPPVIQDAVTERPTSTKHKDSEKSTVVKKPSESSSGQMAKGSASSVTQQKNYKAATTVPPVQQSKRKPVNTELPKVGNTVIGGRENSGSSAVTSEKLNSKTQSSADGSKMQGPPKSAHHLASDMKERDRSHIDVKESSVNQQGSKIPKEDRKQDQHHVSESKTSGGEKKVNKNSKEGSKHEQHKEVKKSSENHVSRPENDRVATPGGEKKVSRSSREDEEHEQREELKKTSERHASEAGSSEAAPSAEVKRVSKNSKDTMQEIKKTDNSDTKKSTRLQQKGDASSQSKVLPVTSKSATSSKEKEELGMKGSLPPKVKKQKPVDSVHHGNKPVVEQKDKEIKVTNKPDETKSNTQKQTDPNISGKSPTTLHTTPEMGSSKKSASTKKLNEAKHETPTQKGGDEIKDVKISQNKVVKEEEEEEPEPSGAPKTRQPERDAEDSGSEKEVPVTKNKIPKNMGGQNAQVYSKADITNQDEWNIIRELDAADDDAEEKPEIAIHQYDTLLRSNPNSPRAWYGKATALDHLAAKKKSNLILDQAIDAYKKVTSGLKNVPDKLFMLATERCIDRMRFRGVHGQAVQIHKLLLERFPDKPEYQNQLAVTYLMINRIPEAKNVLESVLQKWPKNGFAQAHYGFILKTGNYNMTEAVRFLQEGISSREPGTIDGRFFFQLGDALMRQGRRKEAMEVNELGVKEGLFLSKYQRSLYNVDRLRAQPWWSQEETTYAPNFRKLEENWIQIKNEGVQALYDTNKNLFKDEAENLRDSGKWKQLELFARGRKIPSNCAKAPVTCKLIEEFPAARDCRRGQVKFSVMDPGTHVWPHCGPTNCRLRAHLGLVVPKNTFIRVAEETRSWEEGKLFIFDDSFEHEVWHNGSVTRLVLIVDVWHPDLTAEEKLSLPAI